MENKDLLKLLEKMGLVFKNVHSTLEESDVERVKNQISLSRKDGVVEQRVKPTIIRRRVKREEVVPPVPEPAVMEKGLPPEAKKAPIIEVAKPAEEPAVRAAAKKVEERVAARLPGPEEVKAPPPPTVIPVPPAVLPEPTVQSGEDDVALDGLGRQGVLCQVDALYDEPGAFQGVGDMGSGRYGYVAFGGRASKQHSHRDLRA